MIVDSDIYSPLMRRVVLFARSITYGKAIIREKANKEKAERGPEVPGDTAQRMIVSQTVRPA
jgi:hypothetical protein